MAHRARASFLHSSLLSAFLYCAPGVSSFLYFIFDGVPPLFLVFLFFFSLLVSILGLPLSCLQMVYVEHAQAISIFFWINKVSMSLVFVMLCRSLLEILFGQNIFIIFLRLVLWKLESLLMSLSIILQHSEPYRSTDSTAVIQFKFDLLWKGCCLPDVV